MFAMLRIGFVVVMVFILVFCFVAFSAYRAKLRNHRASVTRPAEMQSGNSRQGSDGARPPVPDSAWRPPAWTVTETRASETRTPVSVLDKIRTIDWYHFEKVVGLVYQSQGYIVTHRGGANPDGGIDLLIEKNGERAAVQCKHWQKWKKGKVGVKEVRELVGAMTHERLPRGVIVTLGFTPDAQQLAVQHNINLVDDTNLAATIQRLDPMDQRKVRSMLDDTTKHCPKCEGPMIWRAKSWKPFWGCTRFPRCRGRLYEK